MNEPQVFSCSMRVVRVLRQDFGAVATLAYEDGGGIDIDPGTVDVQFTEDVTFLTASALVTLTLSPA